MSILVEFTLILVSPKLHPSPRQTIKGARVGKSAVICEPARKEGFQNQGKFEEGARREKIKSPTVSGEEKNQK